jgi:hypothetical protein
VAIEAAPESPTTSAGNIKDTVLPVPSLPAAFSPEHAAVPLLLTTHMCDRKADSDRAPWAHGMFVGVRYAADTPKPNSPLTASPQQNTLEFARNAQECGPET